MVIGPPIAPGFRMKIAVFDINARGETHLSLGCNLVDLSSAGSPSPLSKGRELRRGVCLLASDRSLKMIPGRPAKLQNRRIAALHHLNAQPNFHRPAITSTSHKIPNRRRSRSEIGEAREIKRRDETIGVDPNTNAFGENVAGHRERRIQNLPEPTIVLGLDPPTIHTKA